MGEPVQWRAMLRPFSRHVLERTIVLPHLRVLFLPVPKAACTSVLTLLARLADLGDHAFEDSAAPEVGASLTVHDTELWRPEHRLSSYTGLERERVLSEDGWLRFAVVRDPSTRLWSAWQSKLLLREPRFVSRFGDAPWFPRLPEEPADLVAGFREFVHALAGPEPPEDVHWGGQHDLVAQLALTHVGRVERLDETLAALRRHLPDGVELARVPRANASPLPLPPHAYDSRTAAVFTERFQGDLITYGYAPPSCAEAGDWDERVRPLLGMLRTTADAHARVGQLARRGARIAGRAERVERRLHAREVRAGRATHAPVIPNREGNDRYTVRWAWAEAPPAPGITAVVRARDEARSLPWVLPPLLRAVDRLVLVDNGSSDATADVARAVAEAEGAADRLEVHEYPFAIARCGAEHRATPGDSLHSLTYFYNWCFAHVRTRIALKWDADMVLTDAAARTLRALAWQLEAAEAIVRVPRSPLYLAGDGRAFLDLALRNCEPWAWPNRAGYSFVKAMEWELNMWPARPSAPVLDVPGPASYELKHLDADEFSHWTTTDFETSARTRRKRREWEVYTALRRGSTPPDGVVEVVAPAGEHVVDYVRRQAIS